MENQELLKKLREFVCDFTGVSPEHITYETDILHDLPFDSISLLNLATAIEYEFGIEIKDTDLKNIKTIGDFVKIINDRN